MMNDTTNSETICLAGGCFWGTQHFLKQITGVISTEVGYANSDVASPTYKEVCTGRTNAAETVRVVYDPDKVGLGFLLTLQPPGGRLRHPVPHRHILLVGRPEAGDRPGSQ